MSADAVPGGGGGAPPHEGCEGSWQCLYLSHVSVVVPVVVVSLLNLIAMVAVLGYQWFIARTALGITALAAVGLVFLDFVIGLLINTINLSLHQVGISETVETALLALG